MKIAHEGLCAYFATLALGEMPDAARSILFLEDYFARRRIIVRSDPPEGVRPEDPDDFLAGHHAIALLVVKHEYELRRSTDLSELNAIELIVEQH